MPNANTVLSSNDTFVGGVQFESRTMGQVGLREEQGGVGKDAVKAVQTEIMQHGRRVSRTQVCHVAEH